MSNSDKKPKFETPNLTVANVAKVAELFPVAVVDGKENFDLLRSMLGEDIFADNYEFTGGHWLNISWKTESPRSVHIYLNLCVNKSYATITGKMDSSKG